MSNDIAWFACLGIENGMLTKPQAQRLKAELGDDVDLVTFGEAYFEKGFTDDGELLQQMVEIAWEKSNDGEAPPYDPFEKSIEVPAQTTEATASPAVEAAKGNVLPSISADIPDFAAVSKMDEAQVRNAMTGLLAQAREMGASDLHLSAGAQPFIRRAGVIEFLADTVLDANDSRRLNTSLLTEEQGEFFAKDNDLDFALALEGTNRYRVNLMVHRDGTAGTYRVVPDSIQSLEHLGFADHAETINKILSYHNGLILVTGPVGSGKTATLAALVDYLNESREDHIITVESPLEIIQHSKNCNITQREAGLHTRNYASALKGALRQDPDIIVIGEMRDLETIEMAISASETGHLVIGTMHTSDASTTLNRLLDVFPPAQQTQIRAMVAESLRGIICQRLLPGTHDDLVLACEILLNNTAVSALIREGKQQGLSNIMETGKRDGMIVMDACILQLWEDGRISDATATRNIQNRMLKSRITG